MSQLDPASTTVQDICLAALQEARVVGVGQTAQAEDITGAWARLQWMLQQWERKRWLVYHLVTRSITSTGANSYTMGPGGQINTSMMTSYQVTTLALLAGGAGYVVNEIIQLTGGLRVQVLTVNAGVILTFTILPTPVPAYTDPLTYLFVQQVTSGIGVGATFNLPTYTVLGTVPTPAGINSARQERIEAAFLRQLVQSQPNQVDYPLGILESREDFNRIALKQLQAFPSYIFYDSAWPLANVHLYPVPQANIYAIHITIREQLPTQFLTLGTKIQLPPEYFGAILYNLAIRLMSKYGKVIAPGDPLMDNAKDSLNVLRTSNVQIARLQMPKDMQRPGIYNIFSDQIY